AVFICVSYLFGFALAFHDRAIKPATERKNGSAEPSQDSTSQQVNTVPPPLYKATLPILHRSTPLESPPDPQCFHFFFEAGKARLERAHPDPQIEAKVVSKLPAEQRQ